jgi:hypothetical protein
MPIIIVKGTRPSWPVTKIKKVICCKKWANNKADEVYNPAEECLHNLFVPPLSHIARSSMPITVIVDSVAVLADV